MKSLYVYGETDDLDVVEFELRQNVPAYERVLYLPIEHHISTKMEFDRFVDEHRATFPVHGLEDWEVFTASADTMETIIQKVECMYKIHSDG